LRAETGTSFAHGRAGAVKSLAVRGNNPPVTGLRLAIALFSNDINTIFLLIEATETANFRPHAQAVAGQKVGAEIRRLAAWYIGGDVIAVRQGQTIGGQGRSGGDCGQNQRKKRAHLRCFLSMAIS